MEQIGIYISMSLFIGIMLLLVLGLPNKRFKLKIIDDLIKLIFYYVAFVLLILSAYLIIVVFIGSVLIAFVLFKFILGRFFNIPDILNYLSLTFTLLLFAYIPEKVGYLIFCLLERFGEPQVRLSNIYISIVKALRLKIFIYFISFLLIVLSSMEDFFKSPIIHYSLWLQFKPVILQSVVTVIAFDRFFNLATKEFNYIKDDIKKLKHFFSSLFANKDKDVS